MLYNSVPRNGLSARLRMRYEGNKVTPVVLSSALKRLTMHCCLIQGVMFLLPWCITWFGHDLTHYATLVRLFDLFLATEEHMPIYLAASIILKHKDYLLKQVSDLPIGE